MRTYSRNKRSKSATFLIVNESEEFVVDGSPDVKRAKSEPSPPTLREGTPQTDSYSSISGYSERLHDDVLYSMSSIRNGRKKASCWPVARLILADSACVVVLRSQQQTMSLLITYWASKPKLDVADLFLLSRMGEHLFECPLHAANMSRIFRLVVDTIELQEELPRSRERLRAQILDLCQCSREELGLQVISSLISHKDGRCAASAEGSIASYLLKSFLSSWIAEKPLWDQQKPLKLIQMLVEVTEGIGGQQAMFAMTRDQWRSLLGIHARCINDPSVHDSADFCLRLLINSTNGCAHICRALSKGVHVIQLLLDISLQPETPYDSRLLAVGALVNILECDERARAIFPVSAISETVQQFQFQLSGRLSANELVRRLTDESFQQDPEQEGLGDNPTSANVMAGMFALLLAHVYKQHQQVVTECLGGSSSQLVDIIEEFIFFQHKLGVVSDENAKMYTEILQCLK